MTEGVIEQRAGSTGDHTGAEAHADEVQKRRQSSVACGQGLDRERCRRASAVECSGIEHDSGQVHVGADRGRLEQIRAFPAGFPAQPSTTRASSCRDTVRNDQVEEAVDEVGGQVPERDVDLVARDRPPGRVDQSVAVPVPAHRLPANCRAASVRFAIAEALTQ
ncbi:MAG: hypothetical protein R2697_12635 [Ilumatobacteraceae bacterium]